MGTLTSSIINDARERHEDHPHLAHIAMNYTGLSRKATTQVLGSKSSPPIGSSPSKDPVGGPLSDCGQDFL